MESTEYDLIEPFLLPAFRDRWRMLLPRPKGRRKFIHRLSDLNDFFDPKIILQIPANEQSVETIENRLKRGGAPNDCICYVISQNSEIDGKEMALHDALNATVGSCMGTIILCIPGRLAYYEGELPGNRLILTIRKPHPA